MDKFKYIKIGKPKLSSPFCVDGRPGQREINGQKIKAAYPQMLGGSLNSVIIAGVLKTDKNDQPLLVSKNFLTLGKEIFSQLRKASFGLGLHTGIHANPEKHTSDCGFADNLKKIIGYLRENHREEIWQILQTAQLIPNNDRGKWNRIIKKLKKINLDKLPNGETIINKLKNEEGVAFQTLTGNHQEEAAIVNYKNRNTLDVDNSQEKPAFNLDMWRVTTETRALRIDPYDGEILTLGLYTATEIALVEDKGKRRLPFVIRK